jgi:vacuolar-type H+-ATPase subunit E/Vma4
MEAAQTSPSWGAFTVVETGWDPAEVRRVVIDLMSQIAVLEKRLHDGADALDTDAAGSAARTPEAVMASAEEKAADIRDRALASARRIRSRAADETRDITTQARRDALEIVQTARDDANRMIIAARAEEAGVWERVENLQMVVRRTEALLREVAGDEPSGTVVARRNGASDVRVVVAAEQARVERRLQSVPESEDAGLPESVERLLNALKGRDA